MSGDNTQDRPLPEWMHNIPPMEGSDSERKMLIERIEEQAADGDAGTGACDAGAGALAPTVRCGGGGDGEQADETGDLV